MTVGLALVGGAHLPDVTTQAEDLAGVGKRRTPLPGTCLGGEAGASGNLVEVGLGDRRVGLVAAHRRGALVLVVDLCSGAQSGFEAVCPEEGRGSPQPIDVVDLLRDFNPAFGARFLLDEAHREERLEVGRYQRLLGAGVQVWRWRGGQVGDDVVPVRWHLGFV